MTNIRVLMKPHIDTLTNLTSGIHQVVNYYYKYLPEFGIDLVDSDASDYDLVAGHVGEQNGESPYVAHVHGLHWSADYDCSRWQYAVNAKVIDAIRRAEEVTVPSEWVAEAFERDMRFRPHVVHHGIEWDTWQGEGGNGNYVLWNKNRNLDVCDPTPMVELAQRFASGRFITTFAPERFPVTNNVQAVGLIPHNQMKKLVQNALVYLSTTKETFGIGVLEAMASGVPVLGYDHGGNRELVQHGVNGYLAQPGNLDDLAEGLNYCLRHHDTLGDNGRELARKWTWEDACEKVAGIYRLAVEKANQEPLVEITIPVYNKPANEIKRAVDSACNQTYPINAIRIVNDGSDDETTFAIDSIADHAAEQFPNIVIEHIQQPNGGVAIARNKGISQGLSKYVCCLDSDDWIGPRFIEACVADLEADRSLGIVYSALYYHKPDGEEGISKWPNNWDFDAQLRRQNQVPTCCVFRREMWERLGGYRQRYAPTGCGAEDAEFWLRSGAYGYRAQMASSVRPVVEKHHVVSDAWRRPADRNSVVNRGVEPAEYDNAIDALFHYSWQSGYVSGNPDYKEVDWLYWHPWVNDEDHPFASYATPKNNAPSHPVRQYDEPLISVIIPVGPGHSDKVGSALDSLEAQTFRRWEVIVIFDGEMAPASFHDTYPYARLGGDGTQIKGAGHARNLGVEMARAPLLFYLDADDYLKPHCLKMMLDTWNKTGCIPYSDYEGHSVGMSKELVDVFNNQGRLLFYDGDYAAWNGKAAEFDCARALSQPEDPPWIWSLISSLVPKAWHDEIGGFDENAPSWEDWDYWVRLAMAGKGFTHIPEPLVVYHYYTGNRRELGRQIGSQLIAYFKSKYEEINIMNGCGGCGSGSPTFNSASSGINRAAQSRMDTVVDDDFIKCRYIHGNKGEHRFVGPATFSMPLRLPDIRTRMRMLRNSNGTFSIDYGYICGDDVILAHREDERFSAYLQALESNITVVRAPETKRETAPPNVLNPAMSGPATEPDFAPRSIEVDDIIQPTPPPVQSPEAQRLQQAATKEIIGTPPAADIGDQSLSQMIAGTALPEYQFTPQPDFQPTPQPPTPEPTPAPAPELPAPVPQVVDAQIVDEEYRMRTQQGRVLDRTSEVSYSSKDIGALPIPPRALQELRTAKINTIDQVAEWTEVDWIKLAGIASHRATGIIAALQRELAG